MSGTEIVTVGELQPGDRFIAWTDRRVWEFTGRKGLIVADDDGERVIFGWPDDERVERLR